MPWVLALLGPLCASGGALLPTTTCEDQNGYCAAWAASGECEINPRWMHRKCGLACGVCSIPGTPHLERMPIVGWGTCCRATKSREAQMALMREYLRLGGRLIDTAIEYRNHREIGEVLREPEFKWLKREDVFITSKIPIVRLNDAREAIVEILAELQTTYVDLILLHFPWNRSSNIAAWKALEAAFHAGQAKAIGVSNFNVRQLQDLSDDGASVTPMNNQLRLHPGHPQRETLRYCQKHGISITAFKSVKGRLDNEGSQFPSFYAPGFDETIKRLAKKYNITDVQLLLRWAVDHGISVIPGFTSRKHLKETLNVVRAGPLEDLELTSLGGTVVMGTGNNDKQEL